MEGRTTFVIAHRLSTIALADDIVVLEHGRDRGARHARGAAARVRAVRRDRDQGPARPGVPQPRSRRRGWPGCERDARGRPDPPLARHRPGAGASCAGSPCCCALPRPRRADVRLAGAGHRRRARAAAAGQAGDRQGHPAGRPDRADAGSSSRSWPRRSSTGARPTRRPTSSAGSASGRCRTCASSSSPTCRRCRSASTRAGGRRADLAPVQRRRGARHARHATAS